MIPLSRSRSMLSSTCSCISLSVSRPVFWINLSANVDFPWSIWATIQKFRMFFCLSLDICFLLMFLSHSNASLYHISAAEVKKKKSPLFSRIFFHREGILCLFNNEIIIHIQEGVPAAIRGYTPQAGSKRGRPFDFSCSIQYKYGQNMNKNLQLR